MAAYKTVDLYVSTRKSNEFGYQILDYEGISNAIVGGGMGRGKTLIIDDQLIEFKPKINIKSKINKEYVRRLTPREWAWQRFLDLLFLFLILKPISSMVIKLRLTNKPDC